MNLPTQLLDLFTQDDGNIQASATTNNVLQAAAFAAAVNYIQAALKPNDLAATLRGRAAELEALAALVEKTQEGDEAMEKEDEEKEAEGE